MKLDDFDLKLILELHKDGRQSHAELARKFHVTEITIRRRARRLIQNNIISIKAIPHLKAIGYGFTCLVGMQLQKADFKAITAEIASHGKVCFLTKVTGHYDLMAIIVARSSQEFADFLQNVISPIPGILRTETFVNLNIYKGQPDVLDTSQLLYDLKTSV
jgi:Lrp/AsnC family transcriptional regulator for asnA, asnC and gidA